MNNTYDQIIQTRAVNKMIDQIVDQDNVDVFDAEVQTKLLSLFSKSKIDVDLIRKKLMHVKCVELYVVMFDQFCFRHL